MLKVVFLLVILALGAFFAIGCDDSPDEGMAVFGVSDVNDGDPVTAADAGAVPMTFRWRPYFDTEAAIVEATPHGDFVIESYRVTWSGTGTLPAPREEHTSIFVPVFELVTASIVVATPAEAATFAPGSAPTAHIDFEAREMGTDQDAKFAVDVTVHF
jgi:hypothetical protein